MKRRNREPGGCRLTGVPQGDGLNRSESHQGDRPRRRYCFGDFALDLDDGFLRRGVEEVTLRPKALEVLAYLVERHGRLVTKDEVIAAVWPDAVITDNSLAQCLLEIRRALADDSQQLIRTVARRGYILTAPVTTPVVQFPCEKSGMPVELGPLPASRAPRKLVNRHLVTVIVTVLAITTGGLLLVWLTHAEWTYGVRKTPAASIAVLPFVNLGSDKEAEYLSDGFTEELTNAVARIPGLLVTARSSAFRFKGSTADVKDIGRQLGVSTVLEGSVRKVGNRFRVTAQLVDTTNRYHLWSEAYDRDTGEILAIQESIAEAIAAGLKLNLAVKRRGAPAKRTYSAEAYKLVLQARYIPHNRDERIDHYRRALEIDPSYPAAYVGLADEWIGLAVQGTVAPRQVMVQARNASEKALQLDDDEPAAHFVSAMVKWTYDWDWPGADREFLRALQLNPNSALTRVQYSRYLALMGRRQEALTQLDQIRVLDPISAQLRTTEAAIYYLTGDYDRTIEHARVLLAGEEKLWQMYFWLGRAYESKGMLQEAISALEKWREIPGTLQGRGFGMLGSVYARAGRKTDATRLLEWAIAESKRTHISPASVAILYTGLNNPERAIEWLEKAYEERDHSLVSLKTEPAYDSLRSLPKFVALLRRMKLE
jgi:TolB-like protein/DNA-binding winged helix-turn-helix (wHTH) protein